MSSRIGIGLLIAFLATSCAGPAGDDGVDGFNSLIDITAEPAGSNCTYGGQRIRVGMDDGDGGGTAWDGILQAGEIDSIAYVCRTGCEPQSIPAVASDSLSYPSADFYADNIVRAYSNPTGNCLGNTPCDVRGWMGFDLSMLPANAVVVAATLEAFATTVSGAPSVVVQRSAANDWTRGAPGAFSTSDPVVSSPTSLSAADVSSRIAFALDISPEEWATDVADQWATLGFDNVVTDYTYAYFSGSDSPDRATLELIVCSQ